MVSAVFQTQPGEKALPGYVKKHQASVRVCLPGQDPVDGVFSLSPDSPFHSGPQTILELLNSQLRTIPFLIPSSDDDVVLLTRVNIDWVVAGSGVEAELIQSRLLPIT